MADGTRHPVDVIIMATGFHASKMLWPLEIKGGAVARSATSGATTTRAPISASPCRAFRTCSSPMGRTPTGAWRQHHLSPRMPDPLHPSGVARDDREDHAMLEVRQDVHDDYNRSSTKMPQHGVAHPGVTSWYRTATTG